MLATLTDILPVLNEKNVCLPGFDIAGGQPDFLLGVLRACEDARCPALLLLWSPGATYLGLDAAIDLIKFYASRSPIPVILHLDHGSSPEIVLQAMELGFSSVMFDGSTLSLEENIRQTKELAGEAHSKKISIEGEIGDIGSEHESGKKKSILTNPKEAEEFAKKTNVDFLAPSVGNAHGFYSEPPKLRFDIIEDIHKRISIPLSLHGGTGIPMEDIRKAAGLGVRKLNVASLIHKIFSDTIAEDFRKNKQHHSGWRDVLKKGRQAIYDIVRNYITELRVEKIV